MPKPISLFFSKSYFPLCNPINFKLSTNIIGEPDDPPSVPNEYTKYLSNLLFIFPCEYFNFKPPGY